MPISDYVIDAHTLIWYLEENPRLGAGACQVLNEVNRGLYLPVISLAEACWVVARGRSNISGVDSLLEDIERDTRITVVPLDETIVRRAFDFSISLEMHDRMIVATTQMLSSESSTAVLLTCDRAIRSSGLITTLWEKPPSDHG